MSRGGGHRPDVVVLVCRGCCCGTRAKHPHTDHDGQVEALRSAAGDHAGMAVRVVDCLDACERSNVAVVRRPSLPRADRDTWLGGLLTDRVTTELAEWLRAGAPGPLPRALSALRFRPRRTTRP